MSFLGDWPAPNTSHRTRVTCKRRHRPIVPSADILIEADLQVCHVCHLRLNQLLHSTALIYKNASAFLFVYLRNLQSTLSWGMALTVSHWIPALFRMLEEVLEFQVTITCRCVLGLFGCLGNVA